MALGRPRSSCDHVHGPWGTRKPNPTAGGWGTKKPNVINSYQRATEESNLTAGAWGTKKQDVTACARGIMTQIVAAGTWGLLPALQGSTRGRIFFGGDRTFYLGTKNPASGAGLLGARRKKSCPASLRASRAWPTRDRIFIWARPKKKSCPTSGQPQRG